MFTRNLNPHANTSPLPHIHVFDGSHSKQQKQMGTSLLKLNNHPCDLKVGGPIFMKP